MNLFFLLVVLFPVGIGRAIGGVKKGSDFSESSDSRWKAEEVCLDSRNACIRYVFPVLELDKSMSRGVKLENWRESRFCNCAMPSQEKLGYLQYFHIPKCGTSINWFLRDYFGNCEEDESSDPCPRWLSNEQEQREGLCGGRLFSCMGHSVNPNLAEEVLNGTHFLNAFTLLREPFSRIQSDFYYLTSNPFSEHLGPAINVSHLMQYINAAKSSDEKLIKFATYPGISNCATKCGDMVKLTENNLVVAKRCVISKKPLFAFGLMEHVKFGGEPQEKHLRKFREGNYPRLEMKDVFKSHRRQQLFLSSEHYDLSLYEYALDNFLKSLRLAGITR